MGSCNTSHYENSQTRWWFQIFFVFTPTWGKISNLTHIFQMGWYQPPNSIEFTGTKLIPSRKGTITALPDSRFALLSRIIFPCPSRERWDMFSRFGTEGLHEEWPIFSPYLERSSQLVYVVRITLISKPFI